MPKKYNERQKKLASELKESLTRSEFEELALTIAKKVKSIEGRNIKDFKSITDAISKLAKKTEKDNGNNLANINADFKTELDRLKKKYSDFMSSIELRVAKIKDGIDGQNADEELIVEKTLAKIVLPEMPNILEDMPKMGTSIRDALELLSEDERLTVDSVSGIKKLIKKLIDEYDKKKITPLAGVATFNPDSFNTHVINNQVPSGDINGTNKEFTLSLAPSPATSLKFYWNGQLLLAGSDYTLSGKVITMEVAPDTGDNIWSDFMV